MKKYIVTDSKTRRVIAVESLGEARALRDDFNADAIVGDLESPAAIFEIDNYLAYVLAQSELTVPEGLGGGDCLTEVV